VGELEGSDGAAFRAGCLRPPPGRPLPSRGASPVARVGPGGRAPASRAARAGHVTPGGPIGAAGEQKLTGTA
jgi:hypothetical protein